MMFNRNAIFAICLLGVSMGMQSCVKNKIEDYTLKSKEYYNYKSGNIRDYVLDSTSYDWASGKVLKFQFQVRERVISEYTDQSGRNVARLEQYISRDSGKIFEIYAVHTAYVESTGFQRVEENQRYQRLVTPITVKKKWNGNLYNNLGFQEYQYTGVSKPFVSAYNDFPDCVYVMQQNDSTFLFHDKMQEVYAKEVGLVYKYEKHLKYPDTNKIEGYILEWNLKNYWEK